METILTISTICLWILMLGHLLLTFALIRRLNAKGSGTSGQKSFVDLQKGSTAPDFTMKNLNGETVTLASFTGRKLAIAVIATYCNPCKELLPKIQNLQEKAYYAGVELVLVSVEERGVTQRYIEENAITLPVLIAPSKSNTFMQDYKISGTPAFCMITAQGAVYDAGYPHFEGKTWPVFEAFLAEEANVVAARGGNA